MKKYLLIALLFFVHYSQAQTVDTLLNNHGNYVKDTSYTLPRTPGQAFFGYGAFGSVADSIISSFAKNATKDSVILTLKSGARYAVKDSSGGGSSGIAHATVACTNGTCTATVAGISSLDSGLTINAHFITVPTIVSATLNINSLGASLLKIKGSTNFSVADLIAGMTVILTYDGTYWQTPGIINSTALTTIQNTFSQPQNFSSSINTAAIQTTGLNTQGNILMPNGTGPSLISMGENGHSTFMNVGFNGNATPSITSGNDYSRLFIGAGAASATFSGSNALVSQFEVLAPTAIGNSNIQNYQNIYVADRPLGSSHNWSINTGRVRVRESVHISQIDSTRVPASILTLVSNNQGSINAPVMDSTHRNAITNGWTGTITNAGSGYSFTTSTLYKLTGGSGTGAYAFITTNGTVTAITINETGIGYANGDILSATLPGGSGFAYTITTNSPPTGLTIFCSNCVANDSSTGVTQTYNGTTWKSYW